MAKTKVTGGYIADSAITSDHLHTTLNLSSKTLTIGATTVSGHLIPSANITYDLGSSTNRFRDIYLDGTTINLGGTELKKNSDGDIEFKSGSNFKRLVVSELEFDDGTNRKKFKISSGRIKSFDSSGSDDTADKISLSSNTTDDLGEGSSNLYFTTARARGAISASTGIAITDGAISAAAIPNASLTNSSVTINSNSLSLGGTLTLDTDDIGEGSSNLYYTTARWDTKMAAADTDDLSEGSTNLYFTNARARGAISVSGNALSYDSSTGVLTANYEESPSFTGNVSVSGTISSGNITASGSSGATIIAEHNGGGLANDAFIGGFIFKNNDTSGTEPHYAGITARAVSTFGAMALEFFADRDDYENDTPALTLSSVGTSGTTNNLSFQNITAITGVTTINSGAITSTGAIQGASFSDGTISGITFIDEDSFATNSATRVPTQQSIKAYVDAEVAGIVDSAPAALNTLNELAAALGDDANFSTTTSTALGNRLRIDTASQGLTGTQQANAITNLGITATKAELNYVDGVTSNIQTQLNTKITSSDNITGTSGGLSGTPSITVGTISSGAITSSGNLHAGDASNISMDSSANGQLEVDGNGYQGAIALDATAMHIYHNSSSRDLVLGTNETARLTIGGTGGFNFHSNNLTSVGTISSGSITVDPSGTYGDGITINAGDNTTASQSAKQIIMAFGGTNPIDYAHSIRTRHDSGSDTGNTVEFYLWDYGTDSSSTIGTKRALVLENSTGLDLLTGGYKVGGTTVIDSSRNLTNIGTISSGKISTSFSSSHTTSTISHTNAALDLYNPLEANTDEKGTIITFSDNYFDGTNYIKTTRAAIKGGTDTVGNTADGYLAFYTDSGGANTANERLRIDKDGNFDFKTGNFSNIGTISSGAITSSGTLSLGSHFQAGTSVSAGFYQDSANGAYRAIGTGSTRGFYFQSNAGANTYMYIGLTGTYAGRVGVGTSAPAEQFHATGVARVGSFKIGGTTVIDSSRNLTNIGTITSGTIDSSGTSNFDNFRLTDSSVMGFGEAKAGATIGHTASTEEGIFWHTSSDYGIYRTAGAWSSPNYSQLKLKWHTGIEIDGNGTQYGKSGINFLNGNIKMDGTQILDASRNLSNISSITTSGTITLQKTGADSLVDVLGNSSYDPVLNLRSDQGAITSEGFQIWYDNSVGDVHLHTTYANDVSAIRFHTRTGTDKATNNERFTINGDGTIDILSALNEALNFTASTTNDYRGISFNDRTALTADSSDGWLRINNGLEFSNGIFTPGNFRSDGNVRAANFSIGTTTVIDSSRNLTNIGTIAGGKTVLTGTGSSSTYSGVLKTVNTSNDQWGHITLGGSATNDVTNNYYMIGRGSSVSAREFSFHIPNDNNYGDSTQPKFRFASSGSDTLFTVEAQTGTAFHKGAVQLGSANTALSQGGLNSLRIQTNSGRLDIGPMNSSFCHIDTDRPQFYFNKKLIVDEGIVSSYDEDLALQRASVTKLNLGADDHNFYGAGGAMNITMGSATQSSYVDLIWQTNDGDAQLFKAGSSYSGWGGLDAFNIYCSNGDICFHPTATANVLRVNTSQVIATRPILTNSTTLAPNPDTYAYLSANELQFGGNNNAKENNSAQISAGQHQSNSLNFVGMSSNTSSSTRRMDFWVEAGAYFRGSLVCTGNITAYGSASDKRLKKDIVKIDNAIDKIKSVTGYEFAWNENAPEDKQDKREFGVIAQEVEEAGLDKLVFDYERPVSGTDEDNKDLPNEKWKAVHYDKFVPILIEGMKEQQELIEKLTARIEELENK